MCHNLPELNRASKYEAQFPQAARFYLGCTYTEYLLLTEYLTATSDISKLWTFFKVGHELITMELLVLESSKPG